MVIGLHVSDELLKEANHLLTIEQKGNSSSHKNLYVNRHFDTLFPQKYQFNFLYDMNELAH